MRVIAKSALRVFWQKHPEAEQPLRAWYAEAKHAAWSSPHEVRARYGSADILRGGRVVFNIGGNKFRLVVQLNYGARIAYIRFVGTHKEYDQINAETIR